MPKQVTAPSPGVGINSKDFMDYIRKAKGLQRTKSAEEEAADKAKKEAYAEAEKE